MTGSAEAPRATFSRCHSIPYHLFPSTLRRWEGMGREVLNPVEVVEWISHSLKARNRQVPKQACRRTPNAYAHLLPLHELFIHSSMQLSVHFMPSHSSPPRTHTVPTTLSTLLCRRRVDKSEDIVENEVRVPLLLEMECLSVGHGFLLFVDLQKSMNISHPIPYFHLPTNRQAGR
jgi:hypothetical protein